MNNKMPNAIHMKLLEERDRIIVRRMWETGRFSINPNAKTAEQFFHEKVNSCNNRRRALARS